MKIKSLLNNFVLIQVLSEEKSSGGVYMPLVNEKTESEIKIRGIVKMFPESEVYDQSNPHSLKVNVPFEISHGDIVYFHPSCYAEAVMLGMVYNIDGHEHILISYSDCYLAIREGEFIPLNGFCLGTPVKGESKFRALKDAGFVSQDVVHGDDFKNRCIVGRLGALVKEYNHGLDNEVIQPDDPYISAGDELLLVPETGICLEYLTNTIDTFYRFRRRDVLAKIVDNKLISVSDRLLIEEQESEVTSSGIYIPSHTQQLEAKKAKWSNVYSAGPLVSQSFSQVYFIHSQAISIIFEGKKYLSIRESKVLMVKQKHEYRLN
jgi:co-chaperonin GroES (HSP10)